MGLNSKVMLSYQMDLQCRHMQRLFRAYESCCLGWELNVRLACNPQCSAWTTNRTPCEHISTYPCRTPNMLTVLLMEDWSMLHYLSQRENLHWMKSNPMLSCDLVLYCNFFGKRFAPLIILNCEIQSWGLKRLQLIFCALLSRLISIQWIQTVLDSRLTFWTQKPGLFFLTCDAQWI